MSTSRYSGGSFALLYVILFVGCGSRVTAPTSYKIWNGSDKTYSIDYPDTWDAKGGGKHGFQWAEFSSGSAVIRLDADIMTSIRSDNLKGGGSFGPDEVADELRPEATVHEMMTEKVKESFNGYEEHSIETIQTKLGRVRKAEFTARAGLSKIRGYRATFISRQHAMTLICRCPQSNWETLKPSYDHVVASLSSYRIPR